MREPSIKGTAFSCPHCNAYTTQFWYEGYVKFIDRESKVPFIPPPDFAELIRANDDIEEDQKHIFIDRSKKVRMKLLFTDEFSNYAELPILHNLFLSKCYNCKKWTVWVNEDLIYPPKKFGSPPNQDLPQEILVVVEEARAILNLSPKGAAALLRLSIQMLCKHLGERGKDLNDDIASLVKKGLNPIVQKSLDVVRVIGSESVHPGVIDLNDDKDMAIRLFDLINIIAEQMITQPKHVNELYEKLPDGKLSAIEKRDAKIKSDKEV